MYRKIFHYLGNFPRKMLFGLSSLIITEFLKVLVYDNRGYDLNIVHWEGGLLYSMIGIDNVYLYVFIFKREEKLIGFVNFVLM